MHLFCKKTTGSHHSNKRAGAAAVEFAITVPVFLFGFLFPAFEFGRYNMIQQTTSNAAYEAARQCIVPGATVTDGQNAGLAILNDVGIRGATVSMTPNPILNTTTQVTATVTVPVTQNLWITPMFCKSTSVTKSCTMTVDYVYTAH